ncbi:fumarate hydratase [Candidatus Formimonas warabiya]|uniref:Fumarate hydratase n=1 Tax=Formimonas warabiya TaxID=1761012 RepID=A0A3G1KUI1_FORW1|nr:fumarate hydratase [Candidatus Formimonas warabiya]ATW24411.1 fumarate hydratase [Candidatus Formimonas warabiya]ATW26077.1 fumarate hydratase [Candidatus Formimonas warabiya]
MKTIAYQTIVDQVARLCIEANYYLGKDVQDAFQKGWENENSPTGKDIFQQLIENARIAADEQMPMCQDCGVAVVFLEIGQDLSVTGGGLTDAVTQGVIQGYADGYLRKSMCDPFTRQNTGTNAPAIIHTEIVPGDHLKITVAPKGGGSENMSAIAMLPPSAGVEGLKKFIIDRIDQAGSNPCPPILVGVGIGGNFEYCALLAKKALLRKIGAPSPLPQIAELEKDLLSDINKLGIGPAGLGGRITALNVAVEYHPCHIASFPVALNINCHAARHQTVIL